MSNSRGNLDARRALVCVADGDPKLILEVVERTTGYLDDGPLKLLMDRVGSTIVENSSKMTALRLLADNIKAIVTDPKRRHEIITFIGTFGKHEDLV